MRCVVSTCHHDSRFTSSQGITFHMFPSEPSLYEMWLKALNKEGWSPNDDSTVCSTHFLIDDLYLTPSGHCKLRAGAVPMLNQLQDENKSNKLVPCDVQVCRICFTTDSNLYSMKLFKNLHHAFKTLTGLLIEIEDNMPPSLCSECAHQLMKCVSFRNKILQSHLTLQNILRKNECITLEALKCTDKPQDSENPNIKPQQTNTQNNEYQYQVEIEHVKNENIESDEQINPTTLPYEQFILDAIKKEKDVSNQDCDKDQELSHDIVYSPILHKYIARDNIKVEKDDQYNKDSNYEEAPDYDMEQNMFVGEDSADARQAIPQDERMAQHIATTVLAKALLQPMFDSHFKSPDTDSSFTLNDNFSIDNPYHDTAEKPFTCDICKKSFSQKSWLMNHARIHSGERPYTCSICMKTFNDKSNYRKHLRIHSGEKPFPCSYCHKTFNRKNYLENHLRTHSGEKPYSCSICNKVFGHKHHLKSHLRIHSGEKPYSCHICHKFFSEKSNLQMHLKVHTGKNLYSCDVCKVPFTTKYLLKCHSRVHSVKSNENSKSHTNVDSGLQNT